jgi:hypothetical protein
MRTHSVDLPALVVATHHHSEGSGGGAAPTIPAPDSPGIRRLIAGTSDATSPDWMEASARTYEVGRQAMRGVVQRARRTRKKKAPRAAEQAEEKARRGIRAFAARLRRR